MKSLFSLLLSIIFIIASLSIPPSVLADTYGSGDYGSCLYGKGCTATPPSNPIASAISSAGNAISSLFCSDQAPASAPNLYQINVTDTTATLYFAPGGGPYDKHYVAYGSGNNNEGNGAEFATSHSNGALTYEVKQLLPGGVYTFKVRGGNGCRPGAWSANLTIKMQTKGSKVLGKFYPNQQAKYVAAKPASWTTRAQSFVSNLLPKAAPDTGRGRGKLHMKQSRGATPHQAEQPNVFASTWNTVMPFFTGLFK
jgi:hypothetical protein